MPATEPSPAAEPVRLRFTGLARRFGRLPVLSGVSGEAGPGEVLAVTGSNGSGKSTLLRCLAGLLAPDAGSVELFEEGRAVAPGERRFRFGYLAPDLAFYESLTTLENLEFFARLRRVERARGRELLGRVGLPLDRPAGALSSGMVQRLRWAWALLARPRALLLDEPFQNFDDPGRRLGEELLTEHLAGGGLAVVANPTAVELPRVARRLDLDRPA